MAGRDDQAEAVAADEHGRADRRDELHDALLRDAEWRIIVEAVAKRWLGHALRRRRLCHMRRPRNYFRAGVGAVIADGGGRVLVFERRDVPGAWQFPQGGLEENERPLDAVFREIREETGIERRALRRLHQYPDLLAYELPPKARSPKTGLGQVQYWFLFAHRETPVSIPADSEFGAMARVSFRTAVARVVGFKRPVYRKLLAEFGPVIAKLT